VNGKAAPTAPQPVPAAAPFQVKPLPPGVPARIGPAGRREVLYPVIRVHGPQELANACWDCLSGGGRWKTLAMLEGVRREDGSVAGVLPVSAERGLVLGALRD